jgi:hypothetical protein
VARDGGVRDAGVVSEPDAGAGPVADAGTSSPGGTMTVLQP